MVGPAPELPFTLGTSAPKTNKCNLRTNGWELSIGWRDRLNNGLGYSATFTLSDAKLRFIHNQHSFNSLFRFNHLNLIQVYAKIVALNEIIIEKS